MFLWRNLEPDAVTLLLRFLATRNRGRSAAPAAENAAEGGPARQGQAGPPGGTGRAT